MPSCVVKCCKNNSTTGKKLDGITFHKFPKMNEMNPWKNDWIDIIRQCRGKSDWVPSPTSVICSSHFDEKDMYTTKNGYRRVVPYAVPKKLLFKPNIIIKGSRTKANISTSLQKTKPIEILETNNEKESSSKQSNSTTTATTLQHTKDIEVVKNVNQEPSLELSESPSVPLLPTQSIEVEGDNVNQGSSELHGSSNTSIPLPQSQPSQVVNHVKQASSSESSTITLPQKCPIPPHILETPTFVQASLTDTPRSFVKTQLRLNDKLMKKEKIIENYKNKIKTLNQAVRRLKNRNDSLKDIVRNLKNNNNSDLLNRLHKNIAVADLFNIYNRKKQSEDIIYTPAIKIFCLKLNLYSPKAFEYVRETFDSCLPHPTALSKWFGDTNGDPDSGFTEQALKSEAQARKKPHTPTEELNTNPD